MERVAHCSDWCIMGSRQKATQTWDQPRCPQKETPTPEPSPSAWRGHDADDQQRLPSARAAQRLKLHVLKLLQPLLARPDEQRACICIQRQN